MLTPSGRFEPNQRICLSMSDFHPETWNCMWSVSSILQGVVSFMLDNSPAIGTITTSESVKKQLARTSMISNLQNKQVCRALPRHDFMDFDNAHNKAT
jgi:ubiquitin-conjugating enzyme E2 J2